MSRKRGSGCGAAVAGIRHVRAGVRGVRLATASHACADARHLDRDRANAALATTNAKDRSPCREAASARESESVVKCTVRKVYPLDTPHVKMASL